MPIAYITTALRVTCDLCGRVEVVGPSETVGELLRSESDWHKAQVYIPEGWRFWGAPTPLRNPETQLVCKPCGATIEQAAVVASFGTPENGT